MFLQNKHLNRELAKCFVKYITMSPWSYGGGILIYDSIISKRKDRMKDEEDSLDYVTRMKNRTESDSTVFKQKIIECIFQIVFLSIIMR